MHEHLIDLDKIEIYEAGAILVALLAYPVDKHDDPARGALHQSLCAMALQSQLQEDRNWAVAPQAIKPIYALRDHRQVHKDLRTLKRNLRDRMVSGHIAMAHLEKAMTGSFPPLPPGMKRWSVNEAAGLVISDSISGEVCNVKTRIWRPSLPVIHLAAATFLAVDWARKNWPEPIAFGDLILNRPVIEMIVGWAVTFRKVILEHSLFRLTPERMVQLRLA